MADKKDPKPVYNEEQKELIKVATFLQKKGLKEREAVANRKRIYFFRAEKFHELVSEHSEEIQNLLSKHVKIESVKGLDDSKRIGDIMINNGLLKCYDRLQDETKKYKYPKKLVEVKDTSMNEKGFYGFEIYKSQTKMTVLAIVLAVSIIAIILFPLWPYTVKLGIFNILFYFSASMLAMIAVRLVLYIMLFPFGIDFWIFPNLFDDDASIIESFLPFLLINRREDGWPLFAFRVMMVLCFAMYVYSNSGLPLPFEETVETFNEIFEWGRDKMVGNETTQLQFTGKHDTLDDILKMTEEQEREEEERAREETKDTEERDEESEADL